MDILESVKRVINRKEYQRTASELIDKITTYSGEYLDVPGGTTMYLELYMYSILLGKNSLLYDVKIRIDEEFLVVESNGHNFMLEYSSLAYTTLQVVYEFLLDNSTK